MYNYVPVFSLFLLLNVWKLGTVFFVWRIKDRILEDAFVSCRPYSPHRSKPNNMYEWVTIGKPAIFVNWVKWCRMSPERTEDMPNHCSKWAQSELKVSQFKNRWVAKSVSPHPTTHTDSWTWRMRQRIKLSLVESLLWRRRHMNKETFVGIYFVKSCNKKRWLELVQWAYKQTVRVG